LGNPGWETVAENVASVWLQAQRCQNALLRAEQVNKERYLV